MNDPIVDEVRRVRDAHAARFNYDLDAIFQDIKEKERQSGLDFVAGVARQPLANEAQPSTPDCGSSSIDTTMHAPPSAVEPKTRAINNMPL